MCTSKFSPTLCQIKVKITVENVLTIQNRSQRNGVTIYSVSNNKLDICVLVSLALC